MFDYSSNLLKSVDLSIKIFKGMPINNKTKNSPKKISEKLIKYSFHKS